MTRRFVILGQKATASPNFSLLDLAGTSGRLDVLLRALRASLLVSHGVRHDTWVYLVLGGGPLAPRVVRIEGKQIRFVRPDERPLAFLVQKALARAPEKSLPNVFVDIRAGLAVASGGLDAVLDDVATSRGAAPAAFFVLEENACDVHEIFDAHSTVLDRDMTFFLGDHEGFDPSVRERLALINAVPMSIGPRSLHADDAIAVLHNVLDRVEARNHANASR